jgi:hypothetical protein
LKTTSGVKNAMRLIQLSLIAAIIWSLCWVAAGYGLREVQSAWMDDWRNRGWQIDNGDIEVSGFPSTVRLDHGETFLRNPTRQFSWHSAGLSIDSPVWWPADQTVTFSPKQQITVLGQTYEVTSENMTLTASLKPSLALPVNQIGLTAGPWRIAPITNDQGHATETRDIARTDVALKPMQLKPMQLADMQLADIQLGGDAIVLSLLQANGENPAAYRLAANVPGFAPPPSLRALAGAEAPKQFDRLTASATVIFDRPWDRNSVTRTYPQPRQIDLRMIDVAWGALSVNMAGTLSVDNKGIPTGQITVTATNWRDLLNIAQRAQLLTPPMFDTAERGLSMLANLSKDPGTLTVTFFFRDAMVAIGPVPLGPAPRLLIR